MQKSANDNPPARSAYAVPARREIRPAGIGRSWVRFITRSMSASQTQLNAPADAAASAPANSVQKTSAGGGRPRAAITIEAAVVTSSSMMMRGFESS